MAEDAKNKPAKAATLAKRPKAKATQAAPKKTDDVVLVHGRTEDGRGLRVLRKTGDALSAGEVRPAEEGKPLSGDLVRLRPRPEMPLLCDVEVQYESASTSTSSTPEATAPATGRPAKVATESYRSGWGAIWGPRAKKKRLAN